MRVGPEVSQKKILSFHLTPKNLKSKPEFLSVYGVLFTVRYKESPQFYNFGKIKFYMTNYPITNRPTDGSLYTVFSERRKKCCWNIGHNFFNFSNYFRVNVKEKILRHFCQIFFFHINILC